ncbi:Bicaudal D-related protein homolog-like Protein [Tribolium castaneum]|uniref:Bicaudal D-related protein homolog-like Protein n=1 Tax=Tribolium castaneum TaxID=7070 RepID=A0A139WG68_TRICA|nr:Bicaudal D-related protein homolog-like Protein [Tribolium castaneum]
MLKSLEDYIVDMENRSAMDHSQPPTEDVWTQLQQKENDLLLAAELGKALLEKNEELKKQHDAVIEDYSKKLEVCYVSVKGDKLFSYGRLILL